jgi:DNA-binding MarR family transcriptional regulator
MTQFNLTNLETILINTQLQENGCCAETAEELLGDNFSCISMRDFRENTKLTSQTIGGGLSSLEKKGVIWRDDDQEDNILWWVTEDYLESMNPTQKFSTLKS